VIGRITAPYRGLDVFFDHGGEWCDFCSAQQTLWYHLRFAVPIYVVLFYVPALVAWSIRKRRSALKRRSSVAEVESPENT